MRTTLLMLPITALLTATPVASLADDYGVYSAAGELPGQRMARLAEERSQAQAETMVRQAQFEQEQNRQRALPPPLPEPMAAAMTSTTTPPLPTPSAVMSPSEPLPGNAASLSPQPTYGSAPTLAASQIGGQYRSEGVTQSMDYDSPQPRTPSRASSAAGNRDFKSLMDESVTIDVMDMAMEDIIRQLSPSGWRVRFQRISESTLAKRVDLTTTDATRGEVLHLLLARAGLSVEPFPDFDEPLLLISQQ